MLEHGVGWEWTDQSQYFNNETFVEFDEEEQDVE